MTVSVVPGSVTIKVMQYPKINPPVAPFLGAPIVGTPPGPVFAGFTCQGIGLAGAAKLAGAPEDIAACTLGFIQIQWVETYWAYYRGKTNVDGSLLVQAGKPPARPQQACRDCLKPTESRLWVNIADNGSVSEVSVTPTPIGATMDDTPHEAILLGQRNGATGKTNLLREAQIERHFCAILSLQTGDGRFHHLASRYWNVHWQAVFTPSDFDDPFGKPWRVEKVARGNSAAVGPTIYGQPTDRRFANIITAPAAPMCNEILRAADSVIDNFLPDGKDNPSFNPATRRESRFWTSFDVRR